MEWRSDVGIDRIERTTNEPTHERRHCRSHVIDHSAIDPVNPIPPTVSSNRINALSSIPFSRSVLVVPSSRSLARRIDRSRLITRNESSARRSISFFPTVEIQLGSFGRRFEGQVDVESEGGERS